MLQSAFFIGLGLGLLITAILVFWRTVFKVEQGHLAVLTEFGKAEMINESTHTLKTYQPGLHWKRPWKKVHKTSMMERNLDLSGESGGISAMAEDGTIYRLDSKLRYVPLERELYNYLFILKNPTEHIKGLFTCLLRNEIANFGSKATQIPTDLVTSAFHLPVYNGSYALIRRERRLLNQHIADFCQNQISGGYGGVQFCAVDLTDIVPPDELAEALNAVINAQTEADTLLAHTEAECQQRILSAEQGVAIAAAHGKASETEVLTFGRFLNDLHHQGTLPLYVNRRRTEVLAESRAVFRRDTK